MSDFNSSLPVRTEAAGDVIAKIADASTPSQQLAVDSSGKITTKLNDGSGTSLTSTLVNSKQSLDVTASSEGTDGSAVPFGTLQVGGTDGTNLQALSVDSNGQLNINLHDASGNAFTDSNPLPVSISDTIAGATEVLDYKTAASVASNASDTHTYTVTSSKTLKLQKISASASGRIKVEIQLGTIGSEATKVVLFNSTANPNVEYSFNAPQSVPDTDDVLVIITNLDKQSEDVYSTIEGYEV